MLLLVLVLGPPACVDDRGGDVDVAQAFGLAGANGLSAGGCGKNDGPFSGDTGRGA